MRPTHSPKSHHLASPRHPKVFHFISGHDLAMAKILQVPQLWSCFNFSFGSQSFNHFVPMIFHIWPPQAYNTHIFHGTQVPHLSTNHFQQAMPFGAWSTCQGRRCQTSRQFNCVRLCHALPIPSHSWGRKPSLDHWKLHFLQLASKSHWKYLNWEPH